MINQPLTALFKQVILDNRLYDTGALYSSISVETSVQGSNVSITVNALDYIKFHITEYDLTGQFTNNPAFSDEIGNLIASYLQTQVVQMLQNDTEPNFKFNSNLIYSLKEA